MAPIPRRLWLPLLVLARSGGIYSKFHLQKLVFVIQYDGKIDLYNFRRNRYGPYSQELSIETASYPQLIECNLNEAYYSTWRYYYSYKITPEGLLWLKNAEKRMPEGQLRKFEGIVAKHLKMRKYDLLDDVYSKFAIKDESSEEFLKRVSKELKEAMPTFTRWYSMFGNRQTAFLLSNLQIVEQIASALPRVTDTVQKGVCLNLVEEIIQKSMAAADFITPPPKSETLRPLFVEIGDLLKYLLEYCEDRDIYPNPFKMKLEELMTEEEAVRLAKAVAGTRVAA